MIGKIKCLLGYHGWLYSACQLEVGTMRQCQRCLRKEYQSDAFSLWHGFPIWVQIIEEM